jgi:hypothetical protein
MLITNIEKFALDHLYNPCQTEFNALIALPDPIEQVISLLNQAPTWADFVVSQLLELGGIEFPLMDDHKLIDFFVYHRYVEISVEEGLLCIRKKKGVILDRNFAFGDLVTYYTFDPEVIKRFLQKIRLATQSSPTFVIYRKANKGEIDHAFQVFGF